MPLQSTVGTAKTGATSLRTTIPEGIVEFLKVKDGDKLDWIMAENGIVMVRKERKETEL